MLIHYPYWSNGHYTGKPSSTIIDNKIFFFCVMRIASPLLSPSFLNLFVLFKSVSYIASSDGSYWQLKQNTASQEVHSGPTKPAQHPRLKRKGTHVQRVGQLTSPLFGLCKATSWAGDRRWYGQGAADRTGYTAQNPVWFCLDMTRASAD